MGRAVKSQGLAPPAIRKDLRAKQARNIVNKVVPAILASNQRAGKGSENSELITDSGREAPAIKKGQNEDDTNYVKRKGQGKRKLKSGRNNDKSLIGEESFIESSKGKKEEDRNSGDQLPSPSTTACTIRIVVADTLTAAKVLQDERPSRKSANVCVLNMASPLRPGGGVLTGATSQEEFLCARTTLLPSLKEEYYRLPELGGIWTPDVLVFRNAATLGDAAGELAPTERYWLDVISAGMLRFPELEGEEDEIKTLSRQDRQIVENKMGAVLRIAAQKKVKKLVLGAWGCGAYGNPVPDIARAWKKVLDPAISARDNTKSNTDTWPALEVVMFAISNKKMAAEFAHAFGGVEVETISASSFNDDDNEYEEDKVALELRTKIGEIESQISSVWNADLRSRLETILEQLKTQLIEREEVSGSDGGVDIE